MAERQNAKKRHKWLLPAAVLLAGAAWFENFTLSSSTFHVKSRALPAAFAGLRVVQISDLHGRRFDADSRYLLELVQRKSPDLIALTGDLADEFTDLSMLPPLLRGLTALAPTFYVTGNHEWVLSREKRQKLFALLDDAGVIRLPNDYRRLEKGGASIVVAGVDDRNGPYDQKRPAQLVREIRAACGRDAYILMLSHRNDELDGWASMVCRPSCAATATAASSACRLSARYSGRIWICSRTIRRASIPKDRRTWSSAAGSAAAGSCRCELETGPRS